MSHQDQTSADSPPIFLSYARDDSKFCLQLAQDLKNAGIRIWMDQLDIVPGMRWDDEIQVAIDRSETMLVVLSPASIESKNVRDEVNFALDQVDDLVPVLHRQCEIPFRLRRIQHIDFTGDYDQAFERLIDRLTGKPVEGSPKRVVRKRWALAPKYVGYYAAALVSVLVAGGLGWYYSTQPPSAPPSVDAGEDRTIVDVNDDAVERVSLDAGGTPRKLNAARNVDWKKFPTYSEIANTGHTFTDQNGQKLQYVDLLADGIMTGLRRLANDGSDSVSRSRNIEVARAVTNVHVRVKLRNINIRVDLKFPDGRETLSLTGYLHPGNREADLAGTMAGHIPVTGILECMDEDSEHCNVTRVSILPSFADKTTYPHRFKGLYLIQRYGDAVSTLEEEARQSFRDSENAYYVRFVEAFVNTILINENIVTRGAVQAPPGGAIRFNLNGIRAWAVAEGPSRFLSTMTAWGESSDGGVFNNVETTFEGPLLGDMSQFARRIKLEHGNYGAYGEPGSSASLAAGIKTVWLNASGTNGVLSFGIDFAGEPEEHLMFMNESFPIDLKDNFDED